MTKKIFTAVQSLKAAVKQFSIPKKTITKHLSKHCEKKGMKSVATYAGLTI